MNAQLGAQPHDLRPRLGGAIHPHRTLTQLQRGQRWHIERPHAWQNTLHRLARCYERRATVIDAFFGIADTIITVRSLIRQSWTTHRWNNPPRRRP
ncbi:hypothetical protein ACFYW6_39955 [Streptomyces sp. NPDC002659]|uniref:hypothetical protein n=1 Tax=Streptomyces sp. NPDC002659 TaxID=3364656 RepID=UPI0036A9882F